jgi:DNA (cytosine-5)-methyltransferase 1
VNVLDLFSGVGGFAVGLERSGMRTAAFCEIDPHNRRILSSQWPDVPIYGDVRELAAPRLRSDGVVADLVAGGFPCQDASVANIGGQGTAGARTGLFSEAVRLARSLDAGLLMENVPGLFDRGFGDVLRALAAVGYDAEWECISARDAGADHLRNRVWILAYPRGSRWEGFIPNDGLLGRAKASLALHRHSTFGEWRSLVARQSILRGVDGLSIGMERRRLYGIGNAVTPYIPEAIGREIMTAAYSHPSQHLGATND